MKSSKLEHLSNSDSQRYLPRQTLLRSTLLIGSSRNKIQKSKACISKTILQNSALNFTNLVKRKEGLT